MHLVLMDIDGTLLLTDRAGSKSMQEAGKRVLGERWDLAKVEFAGRLDPLIFEDGARLASYAIDDGVHARFREAYAAALRRRLDATGAAHTLPGVDRLVRTLRRREDVTLGLLTGNYAETGAIKLEAAGLDPAWFPVQAWGDDGPDRRSLPPVAMARYTALTGRSIDPSAVIVVGDTVHDIDCAHANGCRVVAVGTGPTNATLADLAAHRPDLLLEDLSDESAFLALLDAGAP